MKESAMSVSSLVGAIDDIARCSSVLAEGIEGGMTCAIYVHIVIGTEGSCRSSVVVVFLEFIKFVAQQEECRKKWLGAENEAIRLKQDIAKITVP